MTATDTISIITEIAISQNPTELIAILANIASGEEKGMNESTFIRGVSTEPDDMQKIGTINEINIIKVKGMVRVLISSILDAKEPRAPYKKA